MPIRTGQASHRDQDEYGIVKFTNCRLLQEGSIVDGDLWINTQTGRIADPQKSFFINRTLPNRVIDLEGKILAPGLLDVQINGAMGFDFSKLPVDGDMSIYKKGLLEMNQKLVKTGVTSYLATMTSQQSDKYHKILPFLGASGTPRNPSLGSESLGVHCEGPFISSEKKGCHSLEVILDAGHGHFDIFADYYGFSKGVGTERGNIEQTPLVKMITMAPELPGAMETIQRLTAQGIIVGIGHTVATYEQTVAAVQAGAKMVTHMFNAINSLHHRDPGPFGVIIATKDIRSLTQLSTFERPYFGIICDGIHLHPASINLAYSAHPRGFILVSDATMFMGMQDGIYDGNNGQRVEKRGDRLTLQGTDIIAGCAVTLLDCINNFINRAGASIGEALEAATSTPAMMLGISNQKGILKPDVDADLVVLDEHLKSDGTMQLEVDQVWKFGTKVFDVTDIGSPFHDCLRCDQ